MQNVIRVNILKQCGIFFNMALKGPLEQV